MKQTGEHSPASHPAVRGRKQGGFTSYLATVLLNRWAIALINALACFVCTIAMIEVVSAIIAHANQHGAGLLLVIGLLAEIAVTCLDLPDHIVNTTGIERQVLSIGVLFVVASMIVMAVHSIKMLLLRHTSDPIP